MLIRRTAMLGLLIGTALAGVILGALASRTPAARGQDPSLNERLSADEALIVQQGRRLSALEEQLAALPVTLAAPFNSAATFAYSARPGTVQMCAALVAPNFLFQGQPQSVALSGVGTESGVTINPAQFVASGVLSPSPGSASIQFFAESGAPVGPLTLHDGQCMDVLLPNGARSAQLHGDASGLVLTLLTRSAAPAVSPAPAPVGGPAATPAASTGAGAVLPSPSSPASPPPPPAIACGENARPIFDGQRYGCLPAEAAADPDLPPTCPLAMSPLWNGAAWICYP